MFKEDFANISFVNRVAQAKTNTGNQVTLYVKTSMATDSIEYFYSIGGRADEEMEKLAVSSLEGALAVIRYIIANF